MLLRCTAQGCHSGVSVTATGCTRVQCSGLWDGGADCTTGAGVDTAERVREGASVFTPKGVRSAHCVPSILVVTKILHLKPLFLINLFCFVIFFTVPWDDSTLIAYFCQFFEKI